MWGRSSLWDKGAACLQSQWTVQCGWKAVSKLATGVGLSLVAPVCWNFRVGFDP